MSSETEHLYILQDLVSPQLIVLDKSHKSTLGRDISSLQMKATSPIEQVS